jgi:RNA polymerase sigma-70 factor (ECF subfamily)
MSNDPQWTNPPEPSTSHRRTSPASDAPYVAEDAMRQLYAQHGDALLAYAARFTGDRCRAEDVVQEAFLRAWRHLPGLLADERPVRPWLLQVTRRLLIDAARAAKARPVLAEDSWSTEPAVDGGLDGLLDRTVLADAIGRLTPAHQRIVIETFFLDNPMHLTAMRLGVPPGTARSRLHYALCQLRRHVDAGSLAA